MNINKIIKHLLAILTLSFGLAQAQTVADGWVIENIHGPSQVGIVDTIPVDLNKDGLMDVVSASIEDGHLRAYINQGNLEFEQQYISTDVPGAFRVSAIDINNDNQTDFLIPSIQTNEIIVLIADPNAQLYGYRKQVIAKNVLLPTDAQAGDFNGDGLIDVVSISFEENLLLLHLQDKQGEFNTTLLSESPQRPRKLVVEDFNNDQLLDILVASSEDNSVRLFSNGGGASFNETLVSDQLTGVRYIARCDLPGAVYPDFVAGVTEANQVLLFQNNENNTFSSSIIDDDLPGADAVNCANLDQDQELEILSISRIEDNIYSQEINDPSAKKLIANTRDGYVTARAFTLKTNEPPLILTQSFFENRNLIYSPQQSNQEDVIWEDFPEGAYFVEKGDLDNDGDEDLVYAAFREGKVYWAENQTNNHSIHVIFDGVDGPQSVTTADVDEDGDLDVISAGAWDDSFWLHENTGKGQFITFRITSTANNAARTAVADLNGDGRLDIIGTSGLDDSVKWFDWDGKTFTEHIIDDFSDGASALSAKDIDQDGDIDLVVANFFGNNISLFTNDGFGEFKKELIATDKLKPSTVFTTDVDGDSDLDIVFAASHAGTVWLLENRSGSFQESLMASRPYKVNSLALVDFDQDGDLDVVDVSDQQGDVSLTKNIDNTVFDSSLLFQNKLGIRTIKLLSDDKSEAIKFAWASNVNNSIQTLTRVDQIFMSGFEEN